MMVVCSKSALEQVQLCSPNRWADGSSMKAHPPASPERLAALAARHFCSRCSLEQRLCCAALASAH